MLERASATESIRLRPFEITCPANFEPGRLAFLCVFIICMNAYIIHSNVCHDSFTHRCICMHADACWETWNQQKLPRRHSVFPSTSRDAFINESYHTCECVKLHVNASNHTHERVTWNVTQACRIRMSCVTHECASSHAWLSHMTPEWGMWCTNALCHSSSREACRIPMRHVIYECLVLQQVVYKWGMSYMNV